MTLDECERHFDAVRRAPGAAEACHALTPLFDVYAFLNLALGRETTFWRARICGERPWVAASEMAYPPARIAPHGRLNDEHSPFFYAATSPETALAEIDAGPGSFAQVAGFRVSLDASIRIARIGEAYHTYKTGYMQLTGTDPDGSVRRYLNELGILRGRRLVFIDAFLADLLADPNARDANYVMSRAVASMIYRNPDIDGFIFPSVRDRLGMNLSLKPDAFDSKLLQISCLHLQVGRLRAPGFVDYEVLNDASALSADGDLTWLPAQRNFKRRYFNLTKEEYDSNGSRLG